MNIDEFRKWKISNPDEYKQAYIKTFKFWMIESILKHKLDDIAFITLDDNNKETKITFKNIIEALSKQNNYCDELVKDTIKFFKENKNN